MSHAFTGRHMLATMVGFFGLVVGVNFTMAWFASDSFGGIVVDNTYVASQRYNGWLAAARAQQQLGWQAEQAVAADRHVTLALRGSAPSTALRGSAPSTAVRSSAGSFTATGTAQHPLGRSPDIVLTFADRGDGRLRSIDALPPGRWNVRTSVHRGAETVRLAGTLQ